MAPRAAAASEGSIKWRLGELRNRARDLRWVTQLSKSSTTNRRSSNRRYSVAVVLFRFLSPEASTAVLKRRRSGDVAADGRHEPLDAWGIAGYSVYCGDVGASNLVEIVAKKELGFFTRLVEVPGQPPRHTASTMSLKVASGRWWPFGSPLSSIRRDASPVLSPLSSNDIGRIRTRPIRPAPECLVMSSGGVRRAGKDESACVVPLVAGTAHLVPDFVCELPFVQQTRLAALQDEPWRR